MPVIKSVMCVDGVRRTVSIRGDGHHFFVRIQSEGKRTTVNGDIDGLGIFCPCGKNADLIPSQVRKVEPEILISISLQDSPGPVERTFLSFPYPMTSGRYWRIQMGKESLLEGERDWHLCPDLDGMLIHSSWPEMELCTCFSGEK